MSVSTRIKQVMLDKPIKVNELAKLLEMNSQVVSNKLYRDKMSFADAEKILNVLDCDIVIRNRETGKEY